MPLGDLFVNSGATKETAQRNVVRGAVSYAFRQVAVTGLSFASSLLLTRLLFPVDFGYIATVNLFLSLIQLVSDGGLGVYLIQRKVEIGDKDLSAVVSLQLGIYLVFHLALSIATVVAFALQSNMFLWVMLWVVSFTIPLSLMRSAPLIKMERGLGFQKIALLETAEQIIYALVVVGLAIVHAGAWSFVFASLARAAFGWALASRYAPWRFTFQRVRLTDDLRKGAAFGIKYQLPSLIEIGRAAVTPLMVGGLLGMQSVGYFDRAVFIANLPLFVLATVQKKVLFPYSARMQTNPQVVRKIFEESTYLSAIIDKVLFLPLLLFLPDLMRILFSEKWMPIVPLVYMISAGSVFLGAIAFSSYPILNGLGESHVMAKLSLANLIVAWLLAWPLISSFGLIGYVFSTQILWLGIFYIIAQVRRYIGLTSVWRVVSSPVIAFLGSWVITRVLAEWLIIAPYSLLQIVGFSAFSIAIFFSILLLLDRQRLLLTLTRLSRNLK